MSLNDYLNKKSVNVGHISPVKWDGQTFYISSFNGLTTTGSVDTTTPEGQRDAYMRCPIVTTVINRKVQAALRGKIAFVDKDGEETQNDETKSLEALLRKPNPFQTWNQFHALADTMRQICGKAILYAAKPEGSEKNKDTKMLYVLPNWLIEEKYTNTYGPLGLFERTVKKYIFTYAGQTIELNPDDVFIWDDQNFNLTNDYDFYSGGSRLISNMDAINTIIAAYEAQEQLLTSAGAIGVLSNVSKDISGTIPIKDNERKKILAKFEGDYGLQRDKNKILITDASLSWQPITRPTKDLMLFESIEDSSRSLSDTFGYPTYLLGFKNNSTYNNLREAKSSLYQDTIIPEQDTLSEAFTKWWKQGSSKDWRMIFTWNHLEIMQQSEVERADALMKRAQVLEIMIRNGAITAQEMADLIDIENL